MRENFRKKRILLDVVFSNCFVQTLDRIFGFKFPFIHSFDKLYRSHFVLHENSFPPNPRNKKQTRLSLTPMIDSVMKIKINDVSGWRHTLNLSSELFCFLLKKNIHFLISRLSSVSLVKLKKQKAKEK